MLVKFKTNQKMFVEDTEYIYEYIFSKNVQYKQLSYIILLYLIIISVKVNSIGY